MLLRASLPNSSGTPGPPLFQILQAIPKREHSKSFATRCLRFLIIRLSPLVATLDQEQVTLLAALDSLKMLAVPAVCLQRKEVPPGSLIGRNLKWVVSLCYFDHYRTFQHMWSLGKPREVHWAEADLITRVRCCWIELCWLDFTSARFFCLEWDWSCAARTVIPVYPTVYLRF